jgi:hypothetical protein
MARSPSTHGVGFADSAAQMILFSRMNCRRFCAPTIADAIKSFLTYADLEMQPTKLKIHIKGASLQHARGLIQACNDNDESLASLRLLLDPDYNCIYGCEALSMLVKETKLSEAVLVLRLSISGHRLFTTPSGNELPPEPTLRIDHC